MSRYSRYLGPKDSITRDDLATYEGKGYICQAKVDGCWCEMICGRSGEPNRLTSRAGKPFDGENSNGLANLDVPLDAEAIGVNSMVRNLDAELIGEIECSTEPATKLYRRLGFRRIHLYDIHRLGSESFTGRPYRSRWAILNEIYASLPEEIRQRILLVPSCTEGFQKFYDWILQQEGYEGVVLKRLDSNGHDEKDGSGKTNTQVRCKRTLTGDYVVMGYTRTAKAQELTALLGLYKRGSLTKVMTGSIPDMALNPDGRLNHEGRVVEFMGWDRFASGALRHAQFCRFRDDKDPLDCTDSEPQMTLDLDAE